MHSVGRRLTYLAMLGAALAQACSSASSPSQGQEQDTCVEDPNACVTGTTCWPTDCADPATCVPRLACLPSVPGKAPHSSCENTLGTPTCSDHQACVQLGPNGGGCVVYCDATKGNSGCQQGESCVDLKVGQPDGSPMIHVCIFIPPPDGGTVPQDDGGIDDATIDVHNDFRF